MSIQNLPLMKAMTAKMEYLDKRQGIIADNIANADTPKYQSKDLTKVDFGAVLSKITDSKKVTLETTNPLHMPNPDAVANAKDRKDKLTYEVAPDKNGVIIEEQMVKSGETQMDYNLMTSLMTKTANMYKIALGRQS
ncbi:MAG: flagellar basal body rod protein FlgB [Micavibrio aeruginosavorus]|uniref:Flagellar basal body rod protein FlgB n=1 Tax=Micavibrio aeruginosavorus TaxID=349221 RepID=A0A2W5Q126_9BACT|nr:MAG: flagellar basal body rod protein FlgB [Micavibrio aeruginosavorus]